MPRPASRDPRARFAEIAARPNAAIELDHAALLIAAEEYPGLDIDTYVRRLDALADRVRSRLHPEAGPHETLTRLRQTLFEEEGFSGNTEHYYDPRNSYLNEVLDRRTGIPITLSTVYLEVARRIGFPLHGVGFPGHFLVKHAGSSGEIVVDPFQGGRVLGPADLKARLEQTFRGRVRHHSKFLRATTPRQLLVRMLGNLKTIYLRRQDHQRALAAIERMLLLAPSAPVERRDRGVLLARLDRPLEALRDLLRYQRLAPDAKDAGDVDELIDSLRVRIGMQN